MRYLSLLIILFSINSFAVTCTNDDIDLNPGDVISADMVKDIFDRISGVSSGMTPEELDGIWMCEAQGSTGDGLNNGYTPNSDGIGASMTQEINFSKQSDDTFLVNYQNKLSPFPQTSGPFVCRGKLNNGALFTMIHQVNETCSTPGIFSMRKVSKSCFVWMASNALNNGAITCQKKTLVPLAPTDLTATLSGSSVSLSWAAGDSSTVSYTVKAKTSNTGTYSDVITENNGTAYTDTLSSGTKWYRVYGINSAGTSTGSNVVSVTAP